MTTKAASFPLLGLVLAIGLLLVFASGEAEASTFNPTYEACLDNATTGTECDGSSAAGASDDILTKTNIASGDSNFGLLVGFIPPEFTVAADEDIPDGAVTGTLFSVASLGLLNGPCNASVVVEFTMVDATTDVNNTIDPLPPGSSDALSPLSKDADNNGIFDAADKYPSFLNETFNNTKPRARQVGIAIVSGVTVVLNFLVFEPGAEPPAESDIHIDASLGYPSVTVLQNPEAPPSQGAISDFCTPLITENVSFGLTRDNPCTPVTSEGKCPDRPVLPCGSSIGINNTNDDPSDDVKVNDGCPQAGDVAESGAECDNNTSEDAEDPLVNDGCPTSGSFPESFIPDPEGCDGDDNEASCVNRANPSADGTFNFVTFAGSQRDADDDGIENGLDPCPFDKTTDWNPRAANPTSDADNDGLPKICDPDDAVPSAPSAQSCPSGFTGLDEDADCFANRQDNCPLKANNQNDGDTDGLGDECDPDPNVDTGHNHELCLVSQINVGAGGTAASIEVPPCSEAATNQSPTATPPPGSTTPTPTSGVAGVGTSGVGSLAPAASSIPTWAAIASGLGGAGLLGGLGTFFSRILHIRLPRWRGRSRD